MTPEEHTKVIERTTREVIERFVKPTVDHQIDRIVTERLIGLVQNLIRQETNRPWRWHFKIRRVEIALRWRR